MTSTTTGMVAGAGHKPRSIALTPSCASSAALRHSTLNALARAVRIRSVVRVLNPHYAG